MGETESQIAASDATWTPSQRIGFRFLAVYFLLYTLPFPLDWLPWIGDKVSQGWIFLWQQAALWVGPRILGIKGEIPLTPTGSGDTTFAYVTFFMMAALAVVFTCAWSLADRKRKAYPLMARCLVVSCRFYLGLYLVVYGLVKTIPNQFSSPGLAALLQTYGSSSPMRLAWTFLGFSPPYTVFAGLMELIPGLLLFFARTRLLGACLAVAVMTNVAMINFCFDVPVKLFSIHLLAMALALVMLDARRLATMFLGNQPVPAATVRPLFDSKRVNAAAAVLGLVLVGSTIWTGITGGIERYKTWGAGRPKPSIWGIHDVETFHLDGEERPPIVTDETYWRTVIIDRVFPVKLGTFEMPGRLGIQHMDGGIVHHFVEFDEHAKTFTLLPKDQTSVADAREAGVEITDVLHYQRPESGRMILRGTFQGHEVEVELRARDLNEILLISRGYHWINEVPFNR